MTYDIKPGAIINADCCRQRLHAGRSCFDRPPVHRH